MINTAIAKTTFYFLLGMWVIVASCLYNFFYQSGLTHPMWNADYNWFPILAEILSVSLLGGAAHGFYLSKLTREDTTELVTKDDSPMRGIVRYAH